jgi:hypothetical protein
MVVGQVGEIVDITVIGILLLMGVEAGVDWGVGASVGVTVGADDIVGISVGWSIVGSI